MIATFGAAAARKSGSKDWIVEKTPVTFVAKLCDHKSGA